MIATTTSALIYFVACHGGPAAHFSVFSTALGDRGYQVKVLATGPALNTLRQLHIDAEELNPDGLNIEGLDAQDTLIHLAERVAKTCQKAQYVITDMAHPLMEHVHAAIRDKLTQVEHFAYYDNPEPYVPGGYSEVAARVAQKAQKVLFSNAKLTTEVLYATAQDILPLPTEKRVGIGYYPVKAAEEIRDLRVKNQAKLRQDFFAKYDIPDQKQKILVYFGGNNEVYFEQAFPAFLKLINNTLQESDPDKYVVLFQQHPGAKKENRDIEAWKRQYKGPALQFIVSEMSSKEAQILADCALYYQTSMGPQLAIAGIPTAQIGHEIYSDILVRNNLAPSLITQEDLVKFLSNLQSPQPKKANAQNQLLEDLGILSNWPERLQNALL